jgi:hypothetical protein
MYLILNILVFIILSPILIPVIAIMTLAAVIGFYVINIIDWILSF